MQLLVTDKVEEGKAIDYKSTLPGPRDEDRREFLADVSSFANTVGGYLIFGMNEEDGLPTELIGVPASGWDSHMLQLESVIRSGISPTLSCHLHTVELTNTNRVLIIKIDRSWYAPHRVTYRGHDKFYARSSKGKFPLDVDQLRAAFKSLGDMERQIKDFRIERLLDIEQDRTPIPMKGVGKMLLHLIPASTMSPFSNNIVWTTKPDPNDLRPLGSSSWSSRRNYEGFLTFGGGRTGPTSSYIQLFHSGILEVVISNLINNSGSLNKKMLFSRIYEEHIKNSLPYLLNFQKKLGLNAPIYLYITLIGCNGALMRDDYFMRDMEDFPPIDRRIMDLPSSVIDGLDLNPTALLKPVFDVAWQACGFEQSLNFDADGNWLNS